MDAFYCIAALLVVSASAQPMVDDGSEAPRDPTVGDVTTPVTISIHDTTPLPPPVNCQTARAAAGACVIRRYCDYGTPNIDRTPYAPHGYISWCTKEQVCCPLDSIVKSSNTSTQNPNNDNDAFEFDEDD